jgi:PiT family inorganic phosphate transporter
VGAITYVIVHAVGGYDGAAIGFALLVALSAAIWLRSRQAPVDSANVNEAWEGGLTPPSVKGATGAEPASTLVDAL